MDGLITTAEMMSRAGIDKHGLRYRRARFPGMITPSRKIGPLFLWRPELVEVLLGLPIRKLKTQ